MVMTFPPPCPCPAPAQQPGRTLADTGPCLVHWLGGYQRSWEKLLFQSIERKYHLTAYGTSQSVARASNPFQLAKGRWLRYHREPSEETAADAKLMGV